MSYVFFEVSTIYADSFFYFYAIDLKNNLERKMALRLRRALIEYIAQMEAIAKIFYYLSNRYSKYPKAAAVIAYQAQETSIRHAGAVASHPIGARQVEFLISAVFKIYNAAMFQETPKNNSNFNSIANAF